MHVFKKHLCVCEEIHSKSVAVLACDAGSREPCCNLEYIRGVFGRLGAEEQRDERRDCAELDDCPLRGAAQHDGQSEEAWASSEHFS